MEHALKVNKRTGEISAKNMRRRGLVPAVVYGKKLNIPIFVEKKELDRNMRHGLLGKLVKFISTDKELKNQLAIFQDYQVAPITGQVIHVDFHAVKSDDVIETHVAITFSGEDRRQNDGSIIEHQLREVKIQCRPTEIPEHLICDVSGLQSGGKITVGDITLPPGVVMLTSPAEIVALAVMPRAKLEEEAKGEALKPDETPVVENNEEK